MGTKDRVGRSSVLGKPTSPASALLYTEVDWPSYQSLSIVGLAHRGMGMEDSPGKEKSQGEQPSFYLFLFAVDWPVFLLREHNTLTERLKSPSLEGRGSEPLGPQAVPGPTCLV